MKHQPSRVRQIGQIHSDSWLSGCVARALETFPGLDFTRKEMTIVGSRASTACFPESLELLSSGKIRYPEAGTQFTLVEAPSVFAKLAKDSGAVHKAVFLCNGS